MSTRGHQRSFVRASMEDVRASHILEFGPFARRLREYIVSHASGSPAAARVRRGSLRYWSARVRQK